jgi:hypothetical protein
MYFGDDDYKEQFWIDPSGKVHKWKGDMSKVNDIISFHAEIAATIYPKAKFPEDVLMDKGWIMIKSTAGGNLIRINPTMNQITTMYNLGYKYLDILDRMKIDIRKFYTDLQQSKEGE